MQERHFEELLTKNQPDGLEHQLTANAFAVKVASETRNLPIGTRIPTAEEFSEMHRWLNRYRTKHPKATEREVKRALKRKFNVRELKNT